MKVLSLGAGVQSSALLLMACRGQIDKPAVAIFADTGWEDPRTYVHLEFLKTEAEKGFRPNHRNPKYIRSRPWKDLCRLQGLPEDFRLPPFKKTEAGRAVGEGVPVHVARAWAKAIKGAFYDEL